jgi:hypothetical protein
MARLPTLPTAPSLILQCSIYLLQLSPSLLSCNWMLPLQPVLKSSLSHLLQDSASVTSSPLASITMLSSLLDHHYQQSSAPEYLLSLALLPPIPVQLLLGSSACLNSRKGCLLYCLYAAWLPSAHPNDLLQTLLPRSCSTVTTMWPKLVILSLSWSPVNHTLSWTFPQP